MNRKFIVIDGKTYNSVDEMPEEVRRQYEQAMRSLKDQNRNGMPDVVENHGALTDNNRNGIPDILENTAGAPLFANAMRIVMDGKEFKTIDDLPPEARAQYEKAMGMLDKNRNGIPDFAEGMMTAQTPPVASVVSTAMSAEPPRSISPTALPVTPTITPDTQNGWLLALLGIVLLMVCAAGAAGVWYFFLR